MGKITAAILLVFLIVALFACRRDSDDQQFLPEYERQVKQLVQFCEQNPKARRVSFEFPSDLPSSDVILSINGVILDPTYCGQRQILHRSKSWIFQTVIVDDITSGIIGIGKEVYPFKVRLRDVENVWKIELYRDGASRPLQFYSDNYSRVGYI